VCFSTLSFDWEDFFGAVSIFGEGNIPLINQLDKKRSGRHTQSN
jgi:hypothetical protein